MTRNGAAESFTDLAELGTLCTNPGHSRGNIIKAGSVRIIGARRVGVVDSDSDGTVVIVQREGDTVTGAEFVCTCGRRATLGFDYEDK